MSYEILETGLDGLNTVYLVTYTTQPSDSGLTPSYILYQVYVHPTSKGVPDFSKKWACDSRGCSERSESKARKVFERECIRFEYETKFRWIHSYTTIHNAEDFKMFEIFHSVRLPEKFPVLVTEQWHNEWNYFSYSYSYDVNRFYNMISVWQTIINRFEGKE